MTYNCAAFLIEGLQKPLNLQLSSHKLFPDATFTTHPNGSTNSPGWHSIPFLPL